MERKYKCIFFDLDHTLWDYEANARETLADLYDAYNLKSKGIPDAGELYLQFRKVNLDLWDLYDRELITQDFLRKERFRQTLGHFSAFDEKLSEALSEEYLSACPKKANLIPHALEALEYLSGRYLLTVVTNGFEEVQKTKISSVDLGRFFSHIITSQKAGHRKPSQKIFEYAMHVNDIKCCDAVMVGDNLLTDIAGARNSSIDTIFFNPGRISHKARVSHEIACLSELRNIL